ncbi:MAG: hypothetical protein ACE5F1_18325 [Planctomycetota bacterium]
MNARRVCAAQKDLPETLDRKDEGSLAGQLFVHGLLTVIAEEKRRGAADRREARVRGVLTKLSDTGGGETLVLPAGRRYRPRTWYAAAASILLAFGLFALWRNLQPDSVEALLGLAIERNQRGVHVYRARWQFEKADGTTSTSIYRIALGGDSRYHVQIEGLRQGTIHFGSDGHVVWAKSPVGDCFELGRLTPGYTIPGIVNADLYYYDLRPLLARILTEDLVLRGYEEEAGGRVALLDGEFEIHRPERWSRKGPRSRRRSRWGRRSRRPPEERQSSERRWREIRERYSFLFPFPSKGRLTIKLEESTGLVLDLRMENSRGTEKFTLKRIETPMDLAAAGFDFDPPRRRTSLAIKLLLTGRRVWKAIREKMR